jgi:MscS family membrane protein
MKRGGIELALVIGLLCLLLSGGAGAWQPLEPPDTSSPRATLKSLLALVDEAVTRYAEYRDAPSPRLYARLSDLSNRAKDLLDLSHLPPAARGEVALDTVVLLWEVIARIDLPDLAEIPDAERIAGPDGDSEPLARWRIPHTAIDIVRIDEGPSSGEYRFSADTVANALSYYEVVKDEPYRRPVSIPDLYRAQQTASGWLIPPAWIAALPDWGSLLVFEQVLWKWIALLLLVVSLALILALSVHRWSRRGRRDGSVRSYLVRLATPLTVVLLTQLVRFISDEQIIATGLGERLMVYLVNLTGGAAMVWSLWVTVTWIADAIIVANEIGIPAYGLVASAGVGGIAIALAAKSTLKNFMGALNLFADRPVRVGDLCRFDEDQSGGWRAIGRIGAIGLRSVKIRKFDRSLLTIPNADFAQRSIVNLSRCDRFLMTTTLGLRHETTDDQLRFLLAELRELLHAHPKTPHTIEDPVRARFVGFGDYSLDVAIRAYIGTRTYTEFLAIQEDILLRIMELVKRAGTGFAFPSQTLYLGRDGGVDQQGQEAAERKVREWASAHTLPFPDFDEGYRKQITDTLDYPPEGSPTADRG